MAENQRAFRHLPRHTAQRLADLRELPFRPGEDREDFALAEVLNPGAEAPPARPQIGFAR